jgi:hypothetical protein
VFAAFAETLGYRYPRQGPKPVPLPLMDLVLFAQALRLLQPVQPEGLPLVFSALVFHPLRFCQALLRCLCLP